MSNLAPLLSLVNMSTESRCEWNVLPSVILLKILSYLPLKDKLSASSTCKIWRSVLFYPKFWQKIVLVFKTSDRFKLEKSRFLSLNVARRIRSCTLQFESVDNNCLLLTNEVFRRLKRNPLIQELILMPSHCNSLPRFNSTTPSSLCSQVQYANKHYTSDPCMYNVNQCSQYYSHHFIESAYECIQSILQSAKGLKTLSLGCLQELTEFAEEFLPLLEQHSRTLSTLSLASVKTDPNSYLLLHLSPHYFSGFENLQVLTVDYDYVNDALLDVLARPYTTSLRRLVFHVHGIDSSHEGTSELAWHRFKQANEHCDLTLNLLHSYDGVEQLNSGLLRPSMPLRVLRAFFCQQINVPAVMLLSTWYCNTLEHLQIVDAFDNRSWAMLMTDVEEENIIPDPLVMLAWRCKKLQHFTLLGYNYHGNNLIAMARLRNSGLKELVIAKDYIECDAISEDHIDDEIDNFIQDVSAGLGRSWAPINLSDQHSSLLHVDDENTDEYFMPTLLNDSLPI